LETQVGCRNIPQYMYKTVEKVHLHIDSIANEFPNLNLMYTEMKS